MKPFYSNKGKYKDGRKKVVIVFDDGRKNFALPKPEKLMDMLHISRNPPKSQREEVDR